jgi:signal transduction histidine kinase
MYVNTRRFAIFILDSEGARQVITGGDRVEDYEAFLNQDPEMDTDQYFYQRHTGKLYRLHINRHQWGTILMGIESRILLDVAGQFGNILLIVIPITMVLVLVGGRFLSRRAMQPVLSAARSAENITVTNLSERLPDYPGQDEFGTLHETLNHMIDRLEVGIKRIQQFTQDAAHELRTPLAILRGELEMSYQDDRIPDEIRDGLQKSLDRTILMSKMVENLMLLAQSDAGRFELQKIPVHFDRLVTDVVEDISVLAEQRPITVTIEHCDPVLCQGDEQLLRRLLLNLSDNALKYTTSGHITYTLRKTSPSLELTISDTGIGIPASDLSHIFDRFYRVDASRSRDNGGSGLGLAICKWIVTVHGGQIKIERNTPEGTTVTLTLPLDAPSSD